MYDFTTVRCIIPGDAIMRRRQGFQSLLPWEGIGRNGKEFPSFGKEQEGIWEGIWEGILGRNFEMVLRWNII